MSIVEFLSQPLWQRLGLTLVHFLWQGLAVAVLVGAFVRVFRLNHGNARYAAYLLALILMIACPVVTFTAIDIPISPNTELVTGAESPEVIDNSSYTALPAGDILPKAETSSPVIPTVANSISWSQRISDWLNVSMPWVLVIWMAGVVVLSVRLLMGFVGVYRWRHHLEPLPERLAQRVASLSNGLGMRQFSRVFISPTVLQAMAVGYLRPMVLLPAAMVTQMQPEMLEAVIAHELAHIRRFDLWVNLAQRVTETLLFYHPAVWWLSNCLRSERELCCDELAVKATGRRLTYATTLESVSRARFMAKQPVLAAGLGQNNKPTLSRVRHVLGLAPAQRNCPFWLAGVIAVVFLAALVIPTALALTNQPDEKLKDLESVVLEGIRANRDKFKCGYLAWSNKQITTRFANSGRPATELAGQYELWWDGKKMATKYMRDQLYKDPEGNFRVEKQQGGNSYDGGVLSRKPGFRDDNWLGSHITRWRGLGAQDWLIRQDSKQESIGKDWSVVDNNGVKVIRAITKNMNETARDYRAYSIRDYDPSKGYGLVNEEWYNPNGSQRLKHTVKMLEVIPGGWFPVEVDFKSFAITDGKVYSHNHHALDIERCSFNDKSALPARVFKGAVDKQLKYQQKLQKYLAMELEGISHVKEIDKVDTVKLGACEAIEKFVAAAMAGDFEKAGEYAHPDRLPANQIADLNEIAKGQSLWIMAVVADDFSAVAVSSVIQGDHDRIGPLVFYLDRVALDGRDKWWVHDIDMETPDGAEVELKQFLEKHPKAQKVPYEKKPDVQIKGEEEPVTNAAFYTPPVTRKIFDTGSRTNCFIDFDKDELYSTPEVFYSWSSSEQKKWMIENGIDAAAETTEGQEGLWGEQIFVLPLPKEAFDRDTPATLLRGLEKANPATLAVMTAIGDLPRTYLFKTQQGGAGLLQILEVQREQKPHYLKIRYKMVPETSEAKARITSDLKLNDLGKAMVSFETDHNGVLPDGLDTFSSYLRNPNDIEWLKDNVKYTGKGKTRKDRPDAVIAYDKSLLKLGQGTNLLFLDAHVEFVGPQRLKSLGIQRSEKTDVQVEVENGREKGSQFTVTPANGVTIEQPATIRVPEDYPTLLAAVDAAKAGDTIVISGGRYYRGEAGEGPADIAVHKLLETRVYDISDLVDTTLDPNTGKVVSFSGDGANNILQQIVDNVAPNSWQQAGGEGKIIIYKGCKLAILQTRNVHQKIGKFLEDIRAEQVKPKPAIAIESRFLIVSEDFLEDIGLDANSVRNTDAWSEHLVEESTASTISETYRLIIDDLHVSFLLRATQAHEDSRVLIAPRVTVFDGKEAALRITNEVEYISGYIEPNRPSGEPIPERDSVNKGLQLQVTPKITPDNRHILLNVGFELSDLLGFEERMYKEKYPYKIPQMEVVSAKTRVSVPNGGTVLIGGQKVTAEEDGQKEQKELIVLIKAEIKDSENHETSIRWLP